MITVTIIGAGSVGIALSKKIEQTSDLGFELIYRSQRSYDRAIQNDISSKNLLTLDNAKFEGKFIAICISDDQIISLAEILSSKYNSKIQNKIAFHTSGSLPKEILSAMIKCNVNIASAHPFQTFANRNPHVLDGIAWGIDADDDTYPELSLLIKKLNGNPILLTKKALQNKSLYHISAVAASNFMALSIEFAKEMAKETGIDPSEFLPRIMETTLQNNINHISSDLPALSGPIVRGDTETITKHLDALGNSANREIYRNLCRALALLAREKKIINKEKYEQFIEILGA